MVRKLATGFLLIAAAAALVAAIATRSRIGHPVTAQMKSAASASAGRAARPVPGVAWEQPTVLIFIKEGCPCSEAAEPCFRRLFSAYGDRASFVGVIDGEPTLASQWIQDHQTPYPVLADPDLEIIRAYGAERSAYVALIGEQGTIERLWPGYSSTMLRELGARLAQAAGMAEATLDLEDAPAELTSGCPFLL